MRLRSLTRRIAGDERPKQFCPILGPETLLDQTRRRTALAVSTDRTLVVVTRTHERFYTPVLAGPLSSRLVVQPENRGTAPAILYALHRLAPMAATDPVAVFPSDHYVSDDAAFMAHVEAAFAAVRLRPELVVLLGITPDRSEVEYGWIEPAEPIVGEGAGAVCRVRRFWEKPSALLAQTLRAEGCLWNSFVMVARVPALLSLINSAVPDLYNAFAPIRTFINTAEEEEVVRALYSRLPSTDFSRQVLAASPVYLAVLPVRGVRWNDLGDPHRVLSTRRQRGRMADNAFRGRAPAEAAAW
ncbi:MAG: hypothetical protein L0191_05345 [Acidobacteria bacterium]|nr:hypothetical protein [Acidobacteriota bacterium]